LQAPDHSDGAEARQPRQQPGLLILFGLRSGSQEVVDLGLEQRAALQKALDFNSCRKFDAKVTQASAEGTAGFGGFGGCLLAFV
jgi:hypothetical protein